MRIATRVVTLLMALGLCLGANFYFIQPEANEEIRTTSVSYSTPTSAKRSVQGKHIGTDVEEHDVAGIVGFFLHNASHLLAAVALPVILIVYAWDVRRHNARMKELEDEIAEAKKQRGES